MKSATRRSNRTRDKIRATWRPSRKKPILWKIQTSGHGHTVSFLSFPFHSFPKPQHTLPPFSNPHSMSPIRSNPARAKVCHQPTPFRLISQPPLSDLTNLPTRRYNSASKNVSSPTEPRNLGTIAAQRIDRLGSETASQSRQSSRDKNEIEADLVSGPGCSRWHSKSDRWYNQRAHTQLRAFNRTIGAFLSALRMYDRRQSASSLARVETTCQTALDEAGELFKELKGE